MNWFSKLTGFEERSYSDTRANLMVADGRLQSLVTGKSYGIGAFDLVSLSDLRMWAARGHMGRTAHGKLSVENITGDIRAFHHKPEFNRALFQVASQFNCLEMLSPQITPEDGVTRYAQDRTQGPACAITAGAATIYRNYFVPVGGALGQTKERQLDGLADVGNALSKAIEKPVSKLYTMQNGYALCSARGLRDITAHIESLTDDETDFLRGLLRIGLHVDIDVTDDDREPRPNVSQAFCSALPVAYAGGLSRALTIDWAPFAQIVLDAAYEATMWAAVVNAQRGASNVVLLTRLGGGAFGNDPRWIDAAMHRAFQIVKDYALDIKIVYYGR